MDTSYIALKVSVIVNSLSFKTNWVTFVSHISVF